MRIPRKLPLIAGSITVLCLAFSSAPAFAELLPAPEFLGSFDTATSPQAPAVDETTGDVYVANTAAGVVEVFDASGAPLSELNGSNTPNGSFNAPSLVTVDGAGDLFVTSTSVLTNKTLIDELTSGGAFISEFDDTRETTRGMAVNAAGSKVYIVRGNGDLESWDAAPAGPGTQAATGNTLLEEATAAEAVSVAVDPASGNILAVHSNYVSQYAPSGARLVNLAEGEGLLSNAIALAVDKADDHLFVDEGTKIVQLEASGPPRGLRSFGEGVLGGSLGIAVNGAAGRAYVSDLTGVDVFSIAVPGIPVVGSEAALSLASRSAELQAQISPHLADTTFYFQYGTDTAYTGGATPSAPGVGVGNGETDQSVRATLNGLQPGTTYHYRVVAVNRFGSEPGADHTLTTTPPLPPPTPIVLSNPPAEAVGTGARPQLPNTYPDLTALTSIPTATEPAGKPKPKPKAKAKQCRKGFVKKHGKCTRKASTRKSTHNKGSK
jgi:hypothetical protein